jgi:hypothetical protein
MSRSFIHPQNYIHKLLKCEVIEGLNFLDIINQNQIDYALTFIENSTPDSPITLSQLAQYVRATSFLAR